MIFISLFLLCSSLCASDSSVPNALTKSCKFEFTKDSEGRVVVLVYDAHGRFEQSFYKEHETEKLTVLKLHNSYQRLPGLPVRNEEKSCQEKQ